MRMGNLLLVPESRYASVIHTEACLIPVADD
jgi:hypothetical protein